MSRCDSLCLPRPRVHVVLRLAALALCITACAVLRPFSTGLQQIHQRDVLEVVAVATDGNATSTTLPHTLAGELTHLFAEDLGVPIHLTMVKDPAQAIQLLRRQEADLALTGLIVGDPQLRRLQLTQPYMQISEQIVSLRDHVNEDGMQMLRQSTLAVSPNSSEATLARQLATSISGLRVAELKEMPTDVLLHQVELGVVDYALISSSVFDTHRALHPDLKVAMELNRGAQLAWAFSKQSENSLYLSAQRFLERLNHDGTLDRLSAFYSQGDTFDDAGVQSFQHDIQQKLPHYRRLFEKYADSSGLDWRILAAIAYQESKWQASAVSPTGVAGIMMLTESTAEDLGVDNRNSAHESIRGGAQYFKQILDDLPDNIAEPDRTWMALAAYNMGPGHLTDAQTLTARLGKNPTKWINVSQHLPLLGQPHWYRHLSHGYTPNSRQALAYVNNVRRYYEALLLATNTSLPDEMRVAIR